MWTQQSITEPLVVILSHVVGGCPVSLSHLANDHPVHYWFLAFDLEGANPWVKVHQRGDDLLPTYCGKYVYVCMVRRCCFRLSEDTGWRCTAPVSRWQYTTHWPVQLHVTPRRQCELWLASTPEWSTAARAPSRQSSATVGASLWRTRRHLPLEVFTVSNIHCDCCITASLHRLCTD